MKDRKVSCALSPVACCHFYSVTVLQIESSTGHNELSGWYYSRDEFLAFMGQVGQLSGNSFHMDNIAGQVIVTGEYSADLTRNRGNRANETEKTMDIEVVHVLRWRDGKVIAGKGAIFGDGATEYDQFWSSSPVVTPSSH